MSISASDGENALAKGPPKIFMKFREKGVGISTMRGNLRDKTILINLSILECRIRILIIYGQVRGRLRDVGYLPPKLGQNESL